MKVRGHCLVWGHNNPEWLVHGQFWPAQMSHLLQEHIATMMKHYAGQVFAWDAVNEALDENGHLDGGILLLAESGEFRSRSKRASMAMLQQQSSVPPA